MSLTCYEGGREVGEGRSEGGRGREVGEGGVMKNGSEEEREERREGVMKGGREEL